MRDEKLNWKFVTVPPETNEINHRNLSTRMSVFALVQQTFLAKKTVVKCLLISTLAKVIYYKVYGTQQNPSLQHKMGWRPAQKISPFFSTCVS
jgi:hypothetical protein